MYFINYRIVHLLKNENIVARNSIRGIVWPIRTMAKL